MVPSAGVTKITSTRGPSSGARRRRLGASTDGPRSNPDKSTPYGPCVAQGERALRILHQPTRAQPLLEGLPGLPPHPLPCLVHARVRLEDDRLPVAAAAGRRGGARQPPVARDLQRAACELAA